ncbi:zinc finger and BTB domain-containing protein 38 isoform X2 [Sorex araneus]|uniref:zinc finger and BTB domain-containing protein 38 isoform X2 n=1 Tax=Sorex araneus TaxID=42254 RepID=UPI0024338397|nr:zinc finger and BTB domain-containing protein 38 isoform X2 [Sorex araneus]
MTVMSLSRDLKDALHSDTVLSVLNEQRIRGILCDVTIIVEDTKFKAHSNVLAASSLYFKNIFWSRAICISSHVLELDDLKAEVFTEILNYIYSSTVVVRRQETVTDLAAAGKRLGIAFLEDLTDRHFTSSPGPYVFCITEKGVVKEEKNDRRPEEPVVTSGPRITNAFSIVETDNSNSMFSPLDLRASFKKASDPLRVGGGGSGAGSSLYPERAEACHEAEPVRTLAEHSYAVSSATEAYRGLPSQEPPKPPSPPPPPLPLPAPPPPGKMGQESSGEAPRATKAKLCRKPKTLAVAPNPEPPAENPPSLPATDGAARPDPSPPRPPPPASGLPCPQSPQPQGEAHCPPEEEENKASDVPGPPPPATAAEVPPLVYNCSSCSKSFDSSVLLSGHMQLHKPTQEPLVCKYCNKQFSTVNRLDRHEQICMRSSHLPMAGGSGSFLENYPTIGQNGGAFAGPGALLAENRVGEFPGAGSGPGGGGALPDEDHMVKFVNGQVLYSCVVCKRSYVTLSSLRRHANVHSWRRTYPCHYCNKVFALAEYRTRHEIWHTGERRYQCIFCLETFMTYYILKNHQKSFHAIDYRLSISKKTANGGLKPSVYPYKLYRLLPMKCKRAPYKSYRHSAYENGREHGRGEAAGPYVIQTPHASELPSLNFQGHVATLAQGPATMPLERSARQDLATPAGVQPGEATKWGKEALKVDLDSHFYSSELAAAPADPAVSSDAPAASAALAVGSGENSAASVISYGGPAPSVIVHSSQFSSVIMHSNALAARPGGSGGGGGGGGGGSSSSNSGDGGHRAEPATAGPGPRREDSRAEPERPGRAASRPRAPKERKKTPAPGKGDAAAEPRGAATGPPEPARAPAPPERGKIETYIAKPALPGTSADSSVAPLCQITVKIGNEAIVKRHILGSKLFYKRGRRPKYAAPPPPPPPPAEPPPPPTPPPATPRDPAPRARSPLGLYQAECVELSEMFDEASDQDSSDKPWRPYYNYKPKKKSRQLRKVRRGGWRKEAAEARGAGGGGGARASKLLLPAELDCAAARPPPDRALEEEEPKEMPKLQCELCDVAGDKAGGGGGAGGQGGQGRPHRHVTARPYTCELCAKHFQSPSTLKMHMRCHTGEKPYPCKTCGRCFSMQGNLQKHQRIHLGVKEFVCQYCSKAFTLNETLKIHQRIHTGEKRYHCQFCLQSFLYLSTKRNHEQRHIQEHNGKGYACFQCPKICKTAAALGMHQKKHLFKSLGQQEKLEGEPGMLETPLVVDPEEDQDQKPHIQTAAEQP